MSKQRISKSDKGCIGFVFGGVLKQSTIRLFKTPDKDPQETYDELTQYYGNITGRYVFSTDVDIVYDKIIKELSEHRISETPLFSVSCSTASETLRSISGYSKCHVLNHKSNDDAEDGAGAGTSDSTENKPKPKSKSKDESKTKTKTKSKSDDNEDGNESESEVDKGNQETKVSSSDSDTDEEIKETKKPKLKKKAKSSKDDDTENEKPKKSKTKAK